MAPAQVRGSRPAPETPAHLVGRGGFLWRLTSGGLVLGATFAAGLWAGNGVVQAAHGAGNDAYAGFATLARVLGTIEAQYIDVRTTETLLESATRGLVSELDPHSRWMDAETWQRLQQSADGVANSAGLTLRQDAEGIMVVAVTARGPADLAGVKPDDRLTHIDGDAYSSAEDATAALTGERGQQRNLQLWRNGVAIEARLVLDRVEEQVVFVDRGPRGVTVSIRRFSRSTASQLDRSLLELGLQPDEAVLLDLRDNPGGLMDQAVAVVDRFVGEGIVVETRGRGGASLQTDRSQTRDDDVNNPLVVLVNHETASAAEVVAGALQDRGRAQLVGQPTYGKGTVQQVYALEDGSALKLTRARYHLPSGRALAARSGLTPDVEVSLGVEALRETLQSAIADASLAPAQAATLSAAIDSALPDGAPQDPTLETGWRTLGR